MLPAHVLLSRAWVGVCCLALGGVRGAQAAAPVEPMQLFEFSAGSALFAPPGVGRDGSIYVGAGDGYLHALESDGGYRWSYTLKGRIVAAPIEDATTARVFVATSEARLYCFEPDGHLRWVFALPAAPKTELSLSAKGTLHFVGRDDHLYGVTTSGALNLRLAAPGARSAPAALEGGYTALVLGESLATLNGYGYRRAALPATFSTQANLAVFADRAVASCEEGRARVQKGESTELAEASDCLSAPIRGSGFFAAAEASGAVRLWSAAGVSRIPLGAAPLRPVWDAPRRRLVLATATGRVRVLELPMTKGAR